MRREVTDLEKKENERGKYRPEKTEAGSALIGERQQQHFFSRNAILA